MKTFILFCFVLTLVCSNALQAQENTFGLKAGLNYMCPNFENVGYDPGVGYQMGAFSSLRIYKPLSLQVEMLFAKKKYEDNPPNFSWEQKTKALYFDIPVFLKMKLLKPLSVYAGGHAGFRINYQSEHNTDNLYLSDEYPPEKMALGILTGIMIHPVKHFSMDLRYSLDIERSDNVADFRGLQVFLCYCFKG